MCVSHAPRTRSAFSSIGSSADRSGMPRIMPQPTTLEMTMTTTALTLDIDRGVALVTLNRPESMNALNTQLREALLATARELDTNDEVNAVVITGAGDKAFCAGADLKERGSKSVQELYDQRRHGRPKFVSAVASMVKPTIAAINGYALGGGAELALQCDILIASERATLGFPEVTIGFLPGGGACQR